MIQLSIEPMGDRAGMKDQEDVRVGLGKLMDEALTAYAEEFKDTIK